MPAINVTRSIVVTLAGTRIRAGELKDLLQECSAGDVIDISYFQADQRDPRESSHVTLTIRQTVSVRPTE